MNKENVPYINKHSFQCPTCKAVAHQDWYNVGVQACYGDDKFPVVYDILRAEEHIKNVEKQGDEDTVKSLKRFVTSLLEDLPHLDLDEGANMSCRRLHDMSASRCYSCGEVSLWLGDRIIHPRNVVVVPMNDDLPSKCKAIYKEASGCLEASPRAACALLRVCLEQMLTDLKVAGKSLDKKIATLVADNAIPKKLQQALDVVRVTGNDAAHLGLMDNIDNKETAISLFNLVNVIADMLISQPKSIDMLYNALPEDKLKGIAARDKTSSEVASDGEGV